MDVLHSYSVHKMSANSFNLNTDAVGNSFNIDANTSRSFYSSFSDTVDSEWYPSFNLGVDTISNYTQNTYDNSVIIYLFIWGFTSLSTLYRSYHDG